MADYIEIAPGLVVSEDGEIIESGSIDDPLKFLVSQRHEANVQIKSWEARRAVLDAVILRKQSERTVDYSGVVCSLRGGSYSRTDSRAFAAGASESIGGLDWEHPELATAILDIIAAATGFKRDSLPESARDAYDAATLRLEKRPWVETSVARRLAPEVTP